LAIGSATVAHAQNAIPPGVPASVFAPPLAVTPEPIDLRDASLFVPAQTRTDGRACDGCPKRSVGRALWHATVINGIYELANLIRGQDTAKITPASWWENMKTGWVWDRDDFGVNQIGHPYQGNNYFNAGRSNGLSFWESSAVTAFGSGTWEYFGETNHASLNDLINTTLGGIALGEMSHRLAWMLRDTKATGKARFGHEFAAFVVDPVTGLNRWRTGDASQVVDKPTDMVPTKLAGYMSSGALFRGTNEKPFSSKGDFFLETDLIYGTPAVGRSRTPFDGFLVTARFGGGSPASEVRVRGRLMSEPFHQERLQFTVMQAYDFSKNDAFQYGAQSFQAHLSTNAKLASRTALIFNMYAGLTPLGAVDVIDPTASTQQKAPEVPGAEAKQGESTGPRYYDYGPGGTFGGGLTMQHHDQVVGSLSYQGQHIFVVDGARANHFLQTLRLSAVVPVHRKIGIGAAAEYFDRRTLFQDKSKPNQYFHYPQFRMFLTWRIS